MSTTAIPHPTVMWAQRPKLVFLTICLSDCQKPEIKVEKNRMSFRGVGGTDKKEHACDIEFLKEIDPDKSKFAVRDRVIEFALEKAEDGPYWERLTKDKTKQHWLKVDFNKWKDEDDSEDEEGGGGGGGAGGADLEEMMRSMGGLGGMGGGMGGPMGGMGGMGDNKMERPNLDDLDVDDEGDSDDEDLPDLE